MYNTIKKYVSKGIKILGLTSLLTTNLLGGSPTGTFTYINTKKPVKRHELFMPNPQSHLYIVKEGDFEKVRVQGDCLEKKLSDNNSLTLGVTGHVVKGKKCVGPVLTYKGKSVRYFTKLDVRFLDGLDVYGFHINKPSKTKIELLGGYSQDKGFYRLGYFKTLKKTRNGKISFGIEGKKTKKKGQSWKTKYFCPVVRYQVRLGK